MCRHDAVCICTRLGQVNGQKYINRRSSGQLVQSFTFTSVSWRFGICISLKLRLSPAHSTRFESTSHFSSVFLKSIAIQLTATCHLAASYSVHRQRSLQLFQHYSAPTISVALLH